jgi:hypothetical protein
MEVYLASVICGSRLILNFPSACNVNKAQRSPLMRLLPTGGPFCNPVPYACIHTCKKYPVHQESGLAYSPLALLPPKLFKPVGDN